MGQEDYNQYTQHIGFNIMSGSPSEDIDPYYECKIRPSTPTMVSNFVLPNSMINKDGPYLEIIQQPQSKFRFRYMSEMAGTHGQLKAEHADKNKNLYPTVKLCNWNRGSALIQLQLYTAEPNANDRKKHVHELNGKYINKDGNTGVCELVVNEENDFTAKFQNLGIIHIAKRDVSNIIYQRKRQDKIDSGLGKSNVKHNISPIDLKQMEKDANVEAKAMDLNMVVLRYQAYWYDDKLGEYVPITDYIDSDVIFNLKNAQTGELKMVRISAVSAPCTGGTEVWMLVEKVKKNNVKVKFFETDQYGAEIWKAYGDFRESDVHHQFAIVFKTPAYRCTNIRSPVKVKVQLERPSDGDTSDIIDFQYTPEILKRAVPYEDVGADIEGNPLKRQRNIFEPINMKAGKTLFLASGEKEQARQSPSHRVPSPVAYMSSPSSQVFYSPPHSSPPQQQMYSTYSDDSNYSEHQIQLNGPRHSFDELIDVHVTQSQGSFNDVSSQNNYIFKNSPNSQSPSPHSKNFVSLLSPNYSQEVPVLSPNYNQMSPYSQQSSPYNQEPMLSPYSNQGGMQCKYPVNSPTFSPPYADVTSPMGINMSEVGREQIKQCDAVIQQVIQSHNDVGSANNHDFSNLLNKPTDTLSQSQQCCDLFEIITNNENMFLAPQSIPRDIIQADCSSKKKSSKETKPKHPNSLIREPRVTSDVDSITSKIASVSLKDTISSDKQSSEIHPDEQKVMDKGERYDVAFDVAVRAAECLQNYAATGDIGLLLATHRYLLAVQNNRGDNSLHTSIGNHNWKAFNKILAASMEVFCKDILNARNYSGETPLHVAVQVNDILMTEKLLRSPGCDITIGDVEGNTPLHIAAGLKNHQCLAAILSRCADKIGNSIAKVINEYNYQGETCLHRAVQCANMNNIVFLLKYGADVHLCERKRGANPLHLAAISGNVRIAQYLTEKTNLTVDAGMFDGNTALHIASQMANAEICSILISAKANPLVTNGLQKSRMNSDSEENDDASEEEDNENEYFTPIDYADGNEEIICILKGEHILSNNLDSGIELQSEEIGVV